LQKNSRRSSIGRGVARDRGGAFQLTGRKRPRSRLPRKPATAAHVQDTRQHTCRLKNHYIPNARRAKAAMAPLRKILACVCDAAQQAAAVAFAQAARRLPPAVLAGAAGKRSKAHAPQLTPRRNKHSSCRERARASRQFPIRSNLVYSRTAEQQPQQPQPQSQTMPVQYDHTCARQRRFADPQAEKEQEETREAITASGSEH